MGTTYNILGNLLPAKNLVTISGGGTTFINGKTLNFTGATAYNYNIHPDSAIAPNTMIGFQSATTSNAIVTLVPISGNIQGIDEVEIGSGDSGIIRTDGTNLWFDSVSMVPNNFGAFVSTPKTFPVNPNITPLVFDSKDATYLNRDYNATTGVFTPTKPGMYQATAVININVGAGTSTTFTAHMLLNTVPIDICNFTTDLNALATLSVSYYGPMNGTTDNLQVVVTQTGSSTSQTISAGVATTYFVGYRVSLF